MNKYIILLLLYIYLAVPPKGVTGAAWSNTGEALLFPVK